MPGCILNQWNQNLWGWDPGGISGRFQRAPRLRRWWGGVERQAIKLQVIKIPSGKGFSQSNTAAPGLLHPFPPPSATAIQAAGGL